MTLLRFLTRMIIPQSKEQFFKSEGVIKTYIPTYMFESYVNDMRKHKLKVNF